MFKKGTILIRKRIIDENSGKSRVLTMPIYEDMVKNEFWEKHSELLEMKCPGSYTWPSGEPMPELILGQWQKINPKDRES